MFYSNKCNSGKAFYEEIVFHDQIRVLPMENSVAYELDGGRLGNKPRDLELRQSLQ